MGPGDGVTWHEELDGQEVEMMVDEIDQLQADSRRYQFLKRHNTTSLIGIAWDVSERATEYGPYEVDKAIDAAIEEEGT